MEQIIGISSGTFFFLVLLAYAAEYVDEQTAARKRKEEEARKKKELGEAKLRAEIEMLEWQSSDEYKGKEAKKMRNLKSKRSKLEKMIYNKQRTVDSSDLISMRLQRLQREPITTAAL